MGQPLGGGGTELWKRSKSIGFFSMSCIGPLLKEVLGGGIVRLDFDDGR